MADSQGFGRYVDLHMFAVGFCFARNKALKTYFVSFLISLELQIEVEVDVPVVCRRHRRVESVGACGLWETQECGKCWCLWSVGDTGECGEWASGVCKGQATVRAYVLLEAGTPPLPSHFSPPLT